MSAGQSVGYWDKMSGRGRSGDRLGLGDSHMEGRKTRENERIRVGRLAK